MGRRRFSVDDNDAVTDDGRCYQSDGRRWRCPMPSLPNKIYCEHHRSLSRRNGANSQKAVSESELPKPNPILAQDSGTDSDPKRGKLHPNVDPLLRRENDEGLELRSPDQSSDQSVVLAVAAAETESKCEKFNCTLNSLVRNKKRRRREKEEESRKEKKRKREKKMEMSEERKTDAVPITEDLLRMAVKRQMERREEREEKKRREEREEKKRREEREEQKRSEEKIEVRRHLRNGVMAISSPVNNSSNVVQIIDRKIGLEKIGLGFNEGSSFKRRFRSKNAEPEPIGVIKKLARVSGRSKNTCHGRRKSTNCKRKGCNTCKPTGAIDAPFEKSTNGQSKVSRIRYADSSICQLLPVLKQPSWEQIFELETEANNQDRRLAGVQLQVVECSDDVRFKCNYCRTSIVDLHRSCSKCCYKLCLSCCREIREESLAEGTKMVSHQDPAKQEACNHEGETPNGIRQELSSGSELYSPMAHELENKKTDESIPCPPHELGGCGDGMLNMKCLLPFGWKQKSDTAQPITSSHDT